MLWAACSLPRIPLRIVQESGEVGGSPSQPGKYSANITPGLFLRGSVQSGCREPWVSRLRETESRGSLGHHLGHLWTTTCQRDGSTLRKSVALAGCSLTPSLTFGLSQVNHNRRGTFCSSVSEADSLPSSLQEAQRPKPGPSTKKQQTALRAFWIWGRENASMNIVRHSFSGILCTDPLRAD